MLFDKHGMLINANQSAAHEDLDKADDLNAGGSGGALSIVDEALADIVLVRKQEMEEWRRKQEQL
jgi:hypothetical protein